jgi:hypothetical protein
MASLGNVNQLFKDLKAEFSKPKPDLKKCGTLLESLKVNKQKIIGLHEFNELHFNNRSIC